MNTPPTMIDLARQRLEILYADVSNDHNSASPGHRIIMPLEREALRTVLDELHRLNQVVSQIKRPAKPPKKPTPKGHRFAGKGAHT
jgi:hypothetical protein